jgi:hypothetical protein
VLGITVLISVAGLLSIHGLDGATATITDQAHSTHGQARDSTPHGVLGICVFVVAMAGLGVAAARAPRQRLIVAVSPRTSALSLDGTSTIADGRSRLAQLCVLRL